MDEPVCANLIRALTITNNIMLSYCPPSKTMFSSFGTDPILDTMRGRYYKTREKVKQDNYEIC